MACSSFLSESSLLFCRGIYDTEAVHKEYRHRICGVEHGASSASCTQYTSGILLACYFHHFFGDVAFFGFTRKCGSLYFGRYIGVAPSGLSSKGHLGLFRSNLPSGVVLLVISPPPCYGDSETGEVDQNRNSSGNDLQVV